MELISRVLILITILKAVLSDYNFGLQFCVNNSNPNDGECCIEYNTRVIGFLVIIRLNFCHPNPTIRLIVLILLIHINNNDKVLCCGIV